MSRVPALADAPLRTDVAALYVDPRLRARFWTRVRKGDGCWLWTGAHDRKGYGQLSAGSRRDGTKRPHAAHRISWVLANGDPGQLCVLHRCDTPACVRPDHLFLGTIADNNRDMFTKGRGAPHSFDERSRRLAVERLPRGDGHYARTEPHRLARGESHGNAIVTAEQVLSIRAERESGASLKALAIRFDIAECTVSAIACRRSWRHI